MATTDKSAEPTRPTIAISMADPERSDVEAALAEAGFDTIALEPGASIVEAFSPSTPTLVAVVDVAGDVDAAIANVAESRAFDFVRMDRGEGNAENRSGVTGIE